jgi:hypothetical protein
VLRQLSFRDFVEGRNLSIEFRWADGHYDRLPLLAAELVGRNVAVIFASDGPLAAKAATKWIPIVFAIGADPVRMGLVESLGRPNSNLTGGAQRSRHTSGAHEGYAKHHGAGSCGRLAYAVNSLQVHFSINCCSSRSIKYRWPPSRRPLWSEARRDARPMRITSCHDRSREGTLVRRCRGAGLVGVSTDWVGECKRRPQSGADLGMESPSRGSSAPGMADRRLHSKDRQSAITVNRAETAGVTRAVTESVTATAV